MARRLTIIVEDAAGIRSLSGWLSDDPDPTIHAREHIAMFDLIIHCPDPFKYSPPVVYAAANGVIRARNEGNADTWPTLMVAGHATAVTLAAGGRRIEWEGDEENLTIDLRSMVSSGGIITVDDSLSLPPGDSTIDVSVTGGGTASLTVRSAWR